MQDKRRNNVDYYSYCCWNSYTRTRRRFIGEIVLPKLHQNWLYRIFRGSQGPEEQRHKDNEEQNFIQKKNVGDEEDTELIVSKDCNRNFNRRKEHDLEIDELSLFTDKNVKGREDEKRIRVRSYCKYCSDIEVSGQNETMNYEKKDNINQPPCCHINMNGWETNKSDSQNYVKSSTLLLSEDCDNYIPTLRVSKVESLCNECGEEDISSIGSPPTCTYVVKSVCTRRKSDPDYGFSPNNPVSSQCSSTSGCEGTTKIHPDPPNDTKLPTCPDIKVSSNAVFINNFDHGYVTKNDTHVTKERPTDDEKGCYIMSTSKDNSQPIDLAITSKQMKSLQESSRSPDNDSMNDEKNSSKQIKITVENDFVCTEKFSLLKKPGIYISK